MRCGKSFAVIMIVIVGLFSARLQGQPLAQGKSMFLGASTSSPVGRFFTKYWNQVTCTRTVQLDQPGHHLQLCIAARTPVQAPHIGMGEPATRMDQRT